jgi:flagellin-like protein
MLSMKGISPLIAAVLLIAFTMAIAGMMATWATTFSREQLETATSEADCIGVLDISSLSFNNQTITVKIRNIGDIINLTGLKANLEYGDASKNREYTLKNYNVTDPLPPASTTWFVVDTGNTTRPNKIEVFASNCPKYAVSLRFM